MWSRVVKYIQVEKDILHRIEIGQWIEGMMIPSENELCELYNVSRITIRRALDDLEKAGKIVRQQGKGTFVSCDMDCGGCSYKGFTCANSEPGIKTEGVLIGRKLVPSTSFLEKCLMLSEPQQLWSFTRLKMQNRKPVAYIETYVTESLGERLLEYDLNNESFLKLYQRIFKIPVSDTVGSVTAVNLDEKIAGVLEMETHSAALLFRSKSYLQDNRPLQVDFIYFNPQFYQFSYNVKQMR